MKKHSLSRRIAWAAAYLGGLGSLGALIGSGFFRCPFALLMHVPCPGCGSTRAVRAALGLHFGEALRWNPMAPFIAACMGVVAAQALVLILRDGSVRDLAARGASPWALKLLALSVALQLPIWALRFFGLFGGPVAV